MEITYSEHALKRMKQRGISGLEVEHVLKHHIYTKNIRKRLLKVAKKLLEMYKTEL